MSQIESEKLFLEQHREDLGINKIPCLGRDRVEEFLNMSWNHITRLSIEDLYSFLDGMVGYLLHLKSEFGRYKSYKVALSTKFHRNLFYESSQYDMFHLDEKKAVALKENPSVLELQNELTNYTMLVEQLTPVIWGIEAKIARLEDWLKFKKFGEHK